MRSILLLLLLIVFLAAILDVLRFGSASLIWEYGGKAAALLRTRAASVPSSYAILRSFCRSATGNSTRTKYAAG